MDSSEDAGGHQAIGSGGFGGIKLWMPVELLFALFAAEAVGPSLVLRGGGGVISIDCRSANVASVVHGLPFLTVRAVSMRASAPGGPYAGPVLTGYRT